ncbi:MAG: S1C family serine protease [Clostridia bacterium]|nr:S1C family serine protease [Clostridia bacterium]
MKKAVIAAACAACAAVITICGCSRTGVVSNDRFTLTDDQYQELLDYYAEHDTSDSARIAAASAQSLFSSVSILAFHTYRDRDSGSGSFFGPGMSSTYYYYDDITPGSGVIMELDKESGDAYILTCCHIVYDDTAYSSAMSSQIYVYLYGQDVPDVNYSVDREETAYGYANSTYYKYTVSGDDQYRMEATVVAASSQYDLALLKVSGSDVIKNSSAAAATFAGEADGDDPQEEVTIGESVYAIGNSFGEGSAVTAGSVSKDSCSVSYSVVSNVSNTRRAIQTSAAVNTGTGGGGLYNTDGELIGIICEKQYRTSSDSNVENTGFALPLSQVKRAYRLLRDSASDSGITYTGVTAGFLQGVSFTGRSTNRNGYYLYDVDDPGYATTYTSAYLEYLDEARETYRIGITETVEATGTSYGLQEGDVITHLLMTDADGSTVEDLDITRKFLLDDALISYRSGYTVTLTYERNGEEGTQEVSCTTCKIA